MTKVSSLLNENISKFDTESAARRLKDYKFSVQAALNKLNRITSSSIEEDDDEAANDVSDISDTLVLLQDTIERYAALLDAKLENFKNVVNMNTSDSTQYSLAQNIYCSPIFWSMLALSDEGKVELAKHIKERLNSMISGIDNPILDAIISKGPQEANNPAYNRVTYQGLY